MNRSTATLQDWANPAETIRISRSRSETSVGGVTLVGAGPGDPELLTLKALNRIRGADAIVHDALVPPAILDYAPSDCLRFDAGKRCADPRSARQWDIQELLAELALSGLDVVRLKGGDPFVFGRGGEEADYLAGRGIPVEIIPGVSSVNGAAASAGIPLTYRGVSAGYTVLNGHGPDLQRVDWAALVALGGTWVFLMARDSLGAIARALLAHGADPALPVALVESATLPNQTVAVAPLALAALGGLAPAGTGPGLLIAGPTAGAALRHLTGILPTQMHERTLSDLSEAAR